MKTTSIVAIFLALVVTRLATAQTATTSAQTLPVATDFHIVDSGENQRVWQRETYELGSDGQIVTHIHKYTELATGLYYKDANGQLQETKETIETYPQGAISRQGQYQVVYANNLNTAGSIDLLAKDGKRLRSNILGLLYRDTVTGNAVLIAQVQDSAGELIADNQVLYPDAFQGVKADVRYTYKRGRFEQDVILREQLPTPESFGLNSATTELEVMTEFINPPEAESSDVLRHDGSLADQEISWGTMRLGHGKAFDLNAPSDPDALVTVSKQYGMVQGRNILLEKVPLNNIQTSLQNLPLHASISPGSTLPKTAAKEILLPKPMLAQTAPKPIKLALAAQPAHGYVLDYVLENMSVYTNFTFQADTTYLISSGCNMAGINTFEGGTVIKYVDSNSVLQMWAAVVCEASAYRPIIMTSCTDNTVGESMSISGAQVYYNDAFSPNTGGVPVNFQHMRISYANSGIHPYNCIFTLTDVQFINCQRPVCAEYATCYFNNVLITGCTNAFWGADYHVNVSHATIDHCGVLTVSWDSPSNDHLSLTNCLLLNVTNNGAVSFTTNYTTRLASDTGVFQTVGAGDFYLATNSPYRNAGTTNLPPAFLADIASKTTYPPVVYSNITISTATTLSPQVQRDSDTPDLGYHYDPVDYLVDLYAVTNATLTISNGTVIASDNTSAGIWLQNGSSINSIGTPLAPNWFVYYLSVQEQSLALGSGTNLGMFINSYHAGGTGPSGVFQFSKFSNPDAPIPAYAFYDVSSWAYQSLLVQNSEIWDGQNNLTGSTNTTATFMNNLFFRSPITANATNLNSALALTNNLMFGVTVKVSQPTNTAWYAFNNDFDTSTLTNSTLTNGYNAYLNCSGRLSPTNAHDVVSSSSLAYQTSWLGSFYQPSSSALINAGSTTADQVGLYHYTSQTNQLKETNSIVDIGYHYVATDSYGNPLDTTGDGTPDYLKDANGDGIYDTGDLRNWLIGQYNGLNTTNNGLSVFTPLK